MLLLVADNVAYTCDFTEDRIDGGIRLCCYVLLVVKCVLRYHSFADAIILCFLLQEITGFRNRAAEVALKVRVAVKHLKLTFISLYSFAWSN